MISSSNLIAVVGLPGTGKSEIVSILSSLLGCKTLYFGGVVLNEVKKRSLPSGPDSEKLVREKLREEHGMAAMAVLLLPYIEDLLSKGEKVVIDGLYSYAEYEVLHSYYSSLVLIGVSSNKSLRYERLACRKVRPLTREQVDARDLAEIDKLDKAKPIVLADIQITNNDSLDILKKEMARYLSVRKFAE